MHIFKLIFLSTLFIASQINAMKVKFSDQIEPTEITDELASIFIPPTQIEKFNASKQILPVDILSTDFEKTKDILLKARQLQTQTHNEEEEKNNVIKIRTLLICKNSEFIASLIKANNFLKMLLLYKATSAIEKADKSRDDAIKIKKPKIKSRLSITTNMLKPFLSETSDGISIPIEANLFNFSYLPQRFEDYRQEELKIRLHTIDHQTIIKLTPLWKMAEELNRLEENEITPPESLNTKHEELNNLMKNLSLEDLSLLLNTTYLLTINPLFEILCLEFNRRIEDKDFLNWFRAHPEKFQAQNQNALEIANPKIYKQIINSIPQIPLLDSSWCVERVIPGYVFRNIIDNDTTIIDYSFNKMLIHRLQSDGTWIDEGPIEKHAVPISAIAVINYKQILIGYSNNTLSLWTNDAQGIKSKIDLVGHKNFVTCATITPEGLIVTGSIDGTIRIWTKQSDEIYTSVELKCDSSITTISAMPNGEIVTGTINGQLTIWTPNPDKSYSPKTSLTGPSHTITAITTMANGEIITGYNNGLTIIWIQQSEGPYFPLELKTNQTPYFGIHSIMVTEDNKIIIGHTNDEARIWSNLQAITFPQQLTLEQILLIKTCKESPLHLENRILREIFESLDIRIQRELVDKNLVIV